MAKHGGAPETVKIFHTLSKESHIFTSPDLPAFLVGHPDLHVAFDMIPRMAGRLVARTYHALETYEPTMTFEEFQLKLTTQSEHSMDVSGKELAKPELTIVAVSSKPQPKTHHR